MALQFERYKIKRGVDLGAPETWNDRFKDLDLRMHARELDAEKIDKAVDALTAVALQRMADTFTPLVDQALEQLANVGAVFEADSVSEVEIGLGQKNVVLTENTRASYVVTDYVALQALDGNGDATGDGLVGAVLSYERETGLMTVAVTSVIGTGTHSSWKIRVSAPPDLAHATNTNNPHGTTAAQVGAYTQQQVDDAIAAAVAAIVNAAGADLDTLGEAETRIVAAEGNITALQGDVAARVAQTAPTGAAEVPAGTTAQRPGSPAAGQLRYNSDDAKFEGHDGSEWQPFAIGAEGVSLADFRAHTVILAELYGDRIDLPNGFFDSFGDFDDVDVAGATNADTGVTGLIKPTATSGVDQTSTHTGATTGGNTVSESGSLGGGYEGWKAFDKVTGVGGAANNWIGSTTTGWLQYLFGSAKTIGSYTIRSGNGWAVRAPKSWSFLGSNDGTNWDTLDTQANVTDWAAGGEEKTFSIAAPASYTHYRIDVTENNGDGDYVQIDEVTLLDVGTAHDMDVDSVSIAASAQPDAARLAVQAKPIDAITINTDLIGYVSRDGGVTWTQVTFVAESSLSDGTTLYVHDGLDISGQPAGTNMQWRIETANNKSVEIHGVLLRWS